MNFLQKIGNWLEERKPPAIRKRTLREVASVGGQTGGDWPLVSLSEDSEVWQNIFALRARMRDLFKCNGYYIQWQGEIESNVFGEYGPLLEMEIKETEDRVVYAPDEKWALIEHERKFQELYDWAASKQGTAAQQYRAFYLAEGLSRSNRDDILRGQAMIKVGQPDIYANQIIEGAWEEFSTGEVCDIRGSRNLNCLGMLALTSCARDGGHFIRHIRDPKINKYGYAIQLINDEWCDYFLNQTLPNGNQVRMGIEYQSNGWGIGKPVAYYFIKRQPTDWMWSVPGMALATNSDLYERVPAEQITHYIRPKDADGTRPPPWGSSTIPNARNMQMYSQAEVISARAEACKGGFFESMDIPDPENAAQVNPETDMREMLLEPGAIRGLPRGIKFTSFDPHHPNGNYPDFRTSQLREWCAGMPGSSYATIGHDYGSMNFAQGKMDRLAYTGQWRMLQRGHINIMCLPVFNNFLEQGLITGGIPLPLAKLKKLNKPRFQGRRWDGVDPLKDINAAALAIGNNLTSRTRVCANGIYGEATEWTTIVFELAREKMLLEQLNLDTGTMTEGVKPAKPAQDTADNEEQNPGEVTPPTPPASKPTNGKNGKKHNRLGAMV